MEVNEEEKACQIIYPYSHQGSQVIWLIELLLSSIESYRI